MAHPFAIAWGVALLSWVAPRPVTAQEMALPAETQWSLFDRILAFDRTFPERLEDGLVVGVLLQERYRASINARDEFIAASRAIPARVLFEDRVRFVSLELTSPGELRRRLEEEGVDVLYLTPVRAQDISQISELSERLGIVTLTGVPEFVEEGIGIGLGLRGGRPEILVNLGVCRSAGMNLGSELLKLATVIGPIS